MERRIQEDPFYKAIERFIKNPKELKADKIVLNGDVSRSSEDLGVLAIFPSAKDLDSYEEVFYYEGQIGELQSVVKSIRKPDRFDDLSDWTDPNLAFKMVDFSRENHLPLAVLVVKKPIEKNNDALVTLYCLKGFDPKIVYETFRGNCISYLSEIN